MTQFFPDDRPPEPTKIVTGESVHAFLLNRLGFNESVLEHGLRAGFANAAMTTANSTAGAFGYRLWDGVIQQMRNELAPAKWTAVRPCGLEAIRRPDNRLQFTASLGDANTAERDITPSCLHPRGMATELAINDNQLSLAGLTEGFEALESWWLLYRVSTAHDQIFAELSLPREISKHRIRDWDTRVILPAIRLGPDELTGRLFDPRPAIDPEVAVRRKA